MEKKYKVESKGSLWQVEISSGAYSDYRTNFYVFAGNSEEEIWEYIKIWAKEEGSYPALIWKGNKFEGKRRDYWDEDREINWETDYGDASDVDIKRLDVVYVNP